MDDEQAPGQAPERVPERVRNIQETFLSVSCSDYIQFSLALPPKLSDSAYHRFLFTNESDALLAQSHSGNISMQEVVCSTPDDDHAFSRRSARVTIGNTFFSTVGTWFPTLCQWFGVTAVSEKGLTYYTTIVKNIMVNPKTGETLHTVVSELSFAGVTNVTSKSLVVITGGRQYVTVMWHITDSMFLTMASYPLTKLLKPWLITTVKDEHHRLAASAETLVAGAGAES